MKIYILFPVILTATLGGWLFVGILIGKWIAQ